MIWRIQNFVLYGMVISYTEIRRFVFFCVLFWHNKVYMQIKGCFLNVMSESRNNYCSENVLELQFHHTRSFHFIDQELT